MPKLIPLFLLALIFLGFGCKSEKVSEGFNCFSTDCRKKLDFVNKQYHKGWEKYYSKPKIKPVVKFKEYGELEEVDCPEGDGSSLCIKNTSNKLIILDGEEFEVSFPSSTLSFPPDTNLQFVFMSIGARIRDRFLKENRCAFNLFCPSPTDEDIVNELFDYYSKK